MKDKLIISIDQGTSSSRVILYNFPEGQNAAAFTVVGQHQMEHEQLYPSSGYVEHCPQTLWTNTLICLAHAIHNAAQNYAKIGSTFKIHSIGVTNQRETTIVWNRRSGLPYHNAIVWNDTRTTALCESLCARQADPLFPTLKSGINRYRDITGLPIATYFSACKLVYLLETVPGLRQDAENGEALFGTVDTWLLYQMTGGRVHATDVSN
eukprot:gene29223-38292_t